MYALYIARYNDVLSVVVSFPRPFSRGCYRLEGRDKRHPGEKGMGNETKSVGRCYKALLSKNGFELSLVRNDSQ